MNFLAHAYLSFNHPTILAGNMISDFVKGSAKFSFSEDIQKGIALHRSIDEFTDNHSAIKEAKQIFRPAYRLYSSPIVDVLLDHYLANDETIFTEETLQQFSQTVYTSLEKNSFQLPPNFVGVLFYMKTQNWLFNYRSKPGIERSLKGLVRRASYLSESDTAFRLFLQHYDYLNECYAAFFKDVYSFARQRFEELISTNP